MSNYRTELAIAIAEANNFTLEDFVALGEMNHSPRGASVKVMDAVAKAIEELKLNPVQLVYVVIEHDTPDILIVVPDWFQAKNPVDGYEAIIALAVGSLLRAIYNIVAESDTYDPVEVLDVDRGRVEATTELSHASRLGN